MGKLLHFLSYHNAIPIVLIVLVMGAGGAFAATNPQAIYSSSQQVLSVDNTYLVGKDLSAYMPKVQITGVTEDDVNYYVAYNLFTIDLKDSVWQDVTKQVVMTVSKADLNQSKDRDLGLYVTEQLKQVTDHELAYLKQVQDFEKQHVTQKIVATQYGGLVGKFLDTTTDTLPGYTPVIAPPPPALVVSAQQPFTAPPPPPSTAGSTSTATTQAPPPTNTPPANDASTTPQAGNPSLAIQVLGNNPAQIPLGGTYNDLGAVATDAQNDNIRIDTYLDGVPVPQVTIKTNATSTHTIKYIAIDPHNNSVAAERTVIVYDQAASASVPSTGSATSTDASSTPPSAAATTTDTSAGSPSSTNTGSSGNTASTTAATSTSPAPSSTTPTTTAPAAATSTVQTTPPPDTTPSNTATTTNASSTAQ